MYNALVSFNWDILENQPLYVKSVRRENKKQGYKIELAIDRSSDNDSLRGEVFSVYGQGIDDIPENSDVKIEIDRDNSTFMRQDFGYMPYVVVKKVVKVPASVKG